MAAYQQVQFINIESIRTHVSAPIPPVSWRGGTTVELILGNLYDAKRLELSYSIEGGSWVFLDLININPADYYFGNPVLYYFIIPDEWHTEDLRFLVSVYETPAGDPVNTEDERYYDITYPITVVPKYYPTDIGPIYYQVPLRGEGGAFILQDTDNLALSELGFIYNKAKTPASGSAYETNVLELPATYEDMGQVWFLDWATLERSDAYFKKYIRTYDAADIPESIYYTPIVEDNISLLRDDYEYYPRCSHYVFDNAENLFDIGLNGKNMIPSGSTGVASKLVSRFGGQRFGIRSQTSLVYGADYIEDEYNFYGDGTFHIAAWVNGIDSSGTSEYIMYKIQGDENDANILGSDGILFVIDGVEKLLKFHIRSFGVTYELNHNIAYLFDENPSRYHLFGAAYNNNTVLLFIDDKKVYRDLSTVFIPNLPEGHTTLKIVGSNIGIDEFLISTGPMIDTEWEDMWQRSRPRISREYLLPQEIQRYVQSRLEFFADDPRALEYHQFSAFGKIDDYRYLPFIAVDNLAATIQHSSLGGSPLPGNINDTWVISIDIGTPKLLNIPLWKVQFTLRLSNASRFSIDSVNYGLFMVTGGLAPTLEVTGDLDTGYTMTIIANDKIYLQTGTGNMGSLIINNEQDVSSQSVNIDILNVMAYDETGKSIPIEIDQTQITVNFSA